MMKARHIAVILMIPVATMLLAARLGAQSTSSSTANVADPASSGPSSSAAPASAQVTPAANFKGHFLWTEEFDGSTNSEGQVMSIDSSVGYVFSPHFGVDAGIPVYFIRGTSTTSTGGTTTTSNNGLGDAYLQLRLAFANPVLDYKTVLTGTAPTGSSSEGLSTGHPTYDWTNHIDHHFGRLVPFAAGRQSYQAAMGASLIWPIRPRAAQASRRTMGLAPAPISAPVPFWISRSATVTAFTSSSIRFRLASA